MSQHLAMVLAHVVSCAQSCVARRPAPVQPELEVTPDDLSAELERQ